MNALGNQLPTRGENTVDSEIVWVGGVGKGIGKFVAAFHVTKIEPLPTGLAMTVVGALTVLFMAKVKRGSRERMERRESREDWWVREVILSHSTGGSAISLPFFFPVCARCFVASTFESLTKGKVYRPKADPGAHTSHFLNLKIMSDYGSATDSDSSDNEFNEIGAGKTVELTDLESGGGQKEQETRVSKMYANPMMRTADPTDSTTDDREIDEDDRARRFQQATQQQDERARVHDRLRARVSNTKGHPTVEERRAARTAKKNNISLTSNAKSTFSKFWNGHLDSSKGKRDQTHHPHGKNWNEDSFKEQKQEHEAAYSHFLKTPFKPDVTYPNENIPHISSTRARVRQALRTPRLVEEMPDASLNNPPSYDPVTHVVTFYGKKYSPLSFCSTNLGTHKCSCCGVGKGDSDIQGYGLGVVLWFKYIKWMGFMFLGLTLLATPQFLMFGSSGKLMGQLETESALHVLAQLGMANMGEGSTLCASGLTSSSTSTKDGVLALQCAKGQTIDQITSVRDFINLFS